MAEITLVPYTPTGQWQQPPTNKRDGRADLVVLYDGKVRTFRNLDASMTEAEALAYAEQRLGINQVWVLSPSQQNVLPRSLEDLIAVVPEEDLDDLGDLRDWQVSLTERALAQGDQESLFLLLAIVDVPATTKTAWEDLLTTGIGDPDWRPAVQISERLAEGEYWYTVASVPVPTGWAWDGSDWVYTPPGMDLVLPPAYADYSPGAQLFESEPEPEPQGKLARWWARVTGGAREI